jgi:iron(III) transport system substrate-binding protein
VYGCKSADRAGDPQYPGAGQGSWTFLWQTKGEEFLLKLAKQDLFVMANARQMAEALANGKITICIGCSRHNVTPFVKAGLPLKLLPIAKEGDEATGGYAVGILKNAPHPNAAKVFVNWLLSKEGESFGARRWWTARAASMSTLNGSPNMTSSRRRMI